MPPPIIERERVDIVFVGSFNPAIFHPEWFARMGLVSELELEKAELDAIVVSKDFTETPVAGLKVVCVQERLSIQTENPARIEQCREMAIAILKCLPHTPVTASGVNASAHYSLSSTEYWHKIGDTLAPKDLVWDSLYENRPGMQSLNIKVVREGVHSGEINTVVAPSNKFVPGLFVKSNWHTPLDKEFKAASSAEFFSRGLEQDWQLSSVEARRVAKKIFQSIPHD